MEEEGRREGGGGGATLIKLESLLSCEKMAEPPLCLVTGASGYIGSWVTYYLLSAGYRVRGTVRSLKNSKKIDFLTSLCPAAKHRLELVEADLLAPASWTAAVAGCAFVLHVASPFYITEPLDPQALIKPAVEGSLNVLRACAAATPPPKRVVLTSSVSAVAYGHGPSKPSSHVFTEADWSVPGGPGMGAYQTSKTLAERAAWDFVGENSVFELCCINPVMVMGPALGGDSASGSLEIVKKFFTSPLPGFPQIPMSFVDVRDVALLHVAALTSPQAAGRRFIACGVSTTMDTMGPPMRAVFAPHGFRVVAGTTPKWALYAASFFMADARLALRNMAESTQVSAAAAEALIGGGFKFRSDAGAMAVGLATSLIAAGEVEDRSRGRIFSSGRSQEAIESAANPRVDPQLQRFAL